MAYFNVSSYSSTCLEKLRKATKNHTARLTAFGLKIKPVPHENTRQESYPLDWTFSDMSGADKMQQASLKMK
jgi:hypothetical protein